MCASVLLRSDRGAKKRFCRASTTAMILVQGYSEPAPVDLASLKTSRATRTLRGNGQKTWTARALRRLIFAWCAPIERGEAAGGHIVLST